MNANSLKVSPTRAKQLMESNGTLLVAAYENGPGFDANRLAGAIPFDELQRREPDLDADRSLIFY